MKTYEDIKKEVIEKLDFKEDRLYYFYKDYKVFIFDKKDEISFLYYKKEDEDNLKIKSFALKTRIKNIVNYFKDI